MCGLTVTSQGNPAEGMCNYFGFHCQAGLDLTGCIVFGDGGCTLFNDEAPDFL